MHLHIHLSLYKQGTLSAVPQLHTPRMLMGMDYGPSISQLRVASFSFSVHV